MSNALLGEYVILENNNHGHINYQLSVTIAQKALRVF